MKPENAERMRQIVLDRLESLQRVGVMQIPRRPPIERPHREDDRTDSTSAEIREVAAHVVAHEPVEIVSAEAALAANSATLVPERRGPGVLFQVDGGESTSDAMRKAPTLEVLQKQVAGCTRCGELAQTRTQTVFGVGNPSARLCFLGEAPGADEDRLGEPFVGRAGQLLTKIIEACKMKREDVYILNMLKCRPPGNRNPLPTELANCREYLDRQLDLIRPEFICCCGAVAAQNLLKTTVPIGKLRGKIHQYRDVKVVCTYHPAFLLRSPSFKKEAWEDMKFLMREMGWDWENM